MAWLHLTDWLIGWIPNPHLDSALLTSYSTVVGKSKTVAVAGFKVRRVPRPDGLQLRNRTGPTNRASAQSLNCEYSTAPAPAVQGTVQHNGLPAWLEGGPSVAGVSNVPIPVSRGCSESGAAIQVG